MAQHIGCPEDTSSSTYQLKYRLIIDTDPGTDDCHAITMFLKHAQVEALTTVFGNVPQEISALNACRILSYLQREDIPVYKGAHTALPSTDPYVHTTQFIHGQDGLNDKEDIPCKVTKQPKNDKAAPSAIVDIVKNNPGEITLVAMGPLTNIAMALKLCPELPKLLKNVYVMGGSTTIGNVTKWAEFNFHCDPLAADVVLKTFSQYIEVQIVPWECCLDNTVSFQEFGTIFSKEDPNTLSRSLLQNTAFTPWYLRIRETKPEKGYVFADQFLTLAILYPDSVLQTETYKCAVVECNSNSAQFGLMKLKDSTDEEVTQQEQSAIYQELGRKMEIGVGGIKIYKQFDMKMMLELYKSTSES